MAEFLTPYRLSLIGALDLVTSRPPSAEVLQPLLLELYKAIKVTFAVVLL